MNSNKKMCKNPTDFELIKNKSFYEIIGSNIFINLVLM